MKKIFENTQTTAEYIESMRLGDIQRLKCNELRRKHLPIPDDMVCYHGNPILQCESWNCQGDSNRLKLGSPINTPCD